MSLTKHAVAAVYDRRRLPTLLLVSLPAIFLSGCFVQSLNPFYTDASRIHLPTVAGEWDFLRAGTEDMSQRKIRPWTFSDGSATNCSIVSYNRDNVAGNLKAVFFQVNGITFCDLQPGDPPEGCVNEFWTMNVRPVHTVARVELKGDVLTFKALDADWMSKALNAREVAVPFLREQNAQDGLPLFTATSQQWQEFLRKNGGNTNAFPEKLAYVLKKRTVNDARSKESKP